MVFTLTLVGTPFAREVVRPLFGGRAMEGRDSDSGCRGETAVHALECSGSLRLRGQGLEAVSPLRGGQDSGQVVLWDLHIPQNCLHVVGIWIKRAALYRKNKAVIKKPRVARECVWREEVGISCLRASSGPTCIALATGIG